MFYKIISTNQLLSVDDNKVKYITDCICDLDKFKSEIIQLMNYQIFKNDKLNEFYIKNSKFNRIISTIYPGYCNIDYDHVNKKVLFYNYSNKLDFTISTSKFLVNTFNNQTKLLYKFLNIFYSVKIEKGNITKYYNTDLYSSGIDDNSLHSSCMNNTDYVNFYNDACSILIIYDIDGKIAGRALLWDCYYIDDTQQKVYFKYCDRIYSTLSYLKDYLINYCKNNNIAYRLNNSLMDKRIMYNDSILSVPTYVEISSIYDYFKRNNTIAYFDTFTYLINDNTLSNKPLSTNIIYFNGTKGFCTFNYNNNTYTSDIYASSNNLVLKIYRDPLFRDDLLFTVMIDKNNLNNYLIIKN